MARATAGKDTVGSDDEECGVTTFGYFLSSEEHGPAALAEQARLAEHAGFEALWISDHYHPWLDAQGQSPFVWGVIGALSQVCDLPVTTAVTCPTTRVHPAVTAQAAATAGVQLDGRFVLGVGTGEALNEHILGGSWPAIDVRLEMLDEAVGLIRALFTGESITWRGEHYEVENARLYTRPDTAPPIYVSAFGPKATDVAVGIADGFISTDATGEMLTAYRAAGGTGPAQGGTKVAFGPDRDEARRMAHRLWPTSGLPGELAQILPTPAHFEQATSIVTEDMSTSGVACGNDPDEHVSALQAFVDAGYDEVYVAQIGPTEPAFFDFYAEHVLPRLRGSAGGLS
jgi:G6PDH family F420-dependent oxidoreductase